MGTASTNTKIRPGTSSIIKRMATTYPGGKAGSGVYQNIINLIPPHDVYIETHLGGGAILRKKRPAPVNIGLDIDPDVIEFWRSHTPANMVMGSRKKSIADILKLNGASGRANLSTTIKIKDAVPESCPGSTRKNEDARSDTHKNKDRIRQTSPEIKSGDGQDLIFKNEDATRWLKNYKFTGNEFIYVDPPYLMETRKGCKLYDYEYTDDDHVELLKVLGTTPAKTMISGYWSSLYDKMLPGWNTFSFEASTRRGMATEWLWFNYPWPDKLHDYSYLGNGFKGRERIKNKRNRWVSRLQKLPVLERNAMIAALIPKNGDYGQRPQK